MTFVAFLMHSKEGFECVYKCPDRYFLQTYISHAAVLSRKVLVQALIPFQFVEFYYISYRNDLRDEIVVS